MTRELYVNIFVNSPSNAWEMAAQQTTIEQAARAVGGKVLRSEDCAEGFYGRSMTVEIPDGQGVSFTLLVRESVLAGFNMRSSCDGQIDLQLK